MGKRATFSGLRQSYYARMLLGFGSVCSCIIIIATICMGTFFFNRLYQVTLDYNTELLNGSKALIEQMLHYVNGSVIQLSVNQTVTKYANASSDSVEYEELGQLQSLLTNMCSANDYTDSIYIVFPEQNRVVSSYGFFAYDIFHDLTWQATADATKRGVTWQGKHTILKDKLTRVTADVVSLVCRVPFYAAKPQGYVVYNVKESFISDLMGRSQTGSFGIMLLIEPDGQVVSASKDVLGSQAYESLRATMQGRDLSALGDTESFGHWTGLTTLQRSAVNDWMYVTYTPFQDLMRASVSLIVVVMLFSFVLIACSLMVIRRLSARLYQPVEALLRCTSDDEQEAVALEQYEEFSQIQRSVRGLIEDKNQLSKTLEGFKPTLVTRFFISLLHGTVQRSAATAQYMDFLGIDTGDAGVFVVFIIVLSAESCEHSSMEQQAFYRLSIRDYAQMRAQKAGLFCHAVQMASGQIVATVGLAREDAANIPRVLFSICSDVSNYIEEELAVSAAICIGEPVDDLMDLSASHDQAFDALEYAYAYDRNPVIFYAAVHQTSLPYINPLSYERSLLGAVKSGNDVEIRAILSQLRQLVCAGKYPFEYVRRIFGGLLNIALLAAQELPAQPGEEIPELLAQRVSFAQSLDDLCALVLDAYLQIACRFRQNSMDKTRHASDAIVRFITQNYYKDISLTDLSNTFLYTTTHLNNLLKATTQKTFYDLLTEVRIDKAKELLATTSLQIGEIGEKVGYLNAQSFIRMFKRVVGMTPGKYRESMTSGDKPQRGA